MPIVSISDKARGIEALVQELSAIENEQLELAFESSKLMQKQIQLSTKSKLLILSIERILKSNG